jgi:hypothetical protein
MMAGDKNSKDSGTDINKNEPPLIFSSIFFRFIQTFQLFVYKNNSCLFGSKNSPFFFKNHNPLFFLCVLLLF